MSFSQEWTCTGAGPYEGVLELDLANFARDNPFFIDTLGLVSPPTTRINLHLTGECVTELPSGTVDRVCIEVVHDELEDFVSYLDFLLWFLGPPTDDFDYIEVIIQGANDSQPRRLTIDAEGVWGGQLGLRGAGAKSLVSVVAHRRDGTTLDLTETVADSIDGRDFTVRFPEEDRFGECD